MKHQREMGIPSICARIGGVKALLACTLTAMTCCISAIAVDPPCAPPPDGLRAWFPFEQSGVDVVSGSNATLLGLPAFSSGRVGQGLRFDGVDDAARLSASSALDLGAGPGLTVEMWLNPQRLDSPMSLLEWSSTTGPEPGLHLYASVNGAGTLFANLTDTNGVAHQFTTPAGVLSTGVFQHVAFTYDRGSGLARFLVNGAQVAQGNFGDLRLETRPDLWFGQRILGGTPYRFAGTMDEVSLYGRALGSNELQAIYTAGALGKCSTNTPPPPQGPVIVQQPAGTNVLAGQAAIFSVVAQGASPLRYQWLRNNFPLLGRTDAVLILSNVQPSQAGSYSVLVSNLINSIVSTNAILTVTSPTNNPPTNCFNPPSGLVAWLPFEQSGVDVVRGSNAVLLGAPAFGAGRVGQALSLDGVDDAGRLSSSSALDVGSASGMSAEMWIRPEDVQTPGALLEWSDAASRLGVHFYLASDSPGSLFANLVDTNGNAHSFSTPAA